LEGFELFKTEYQSTADLLKIIQTHPKVVICAKLDPKTGGCQTWHNFANITWWSQALI